jgi:hypothetical protein
VTALSQKSEEPIFIIGSHHFGTKLAFSEAKKQNKNFNVVNLTLDLNNGLGDVFCDIVPLNESGFYVETL